MCCFQGCSRCRRRDKVTLRGLTVEEMHITFLQLYYNSNNYGLFFNVSKMSANVNHHPFKGLNFILMLIIPEIPHLKRPH